MTPSKSAKTSILVQSRNGLVANSLVAAEYGVNAATINAWRKRGLIRAHRVNMRCWMYDRAEVREDLAKQGIEPLRH